MGAVALVTSSLPPRAHAHPTSSESSAALTDDIAAKREEAARIADEVEGLGARASIAVEEYRQAQARLTEADAVLFETRRRVDDMRRLHETTRAEADERIVAMYQGESAPNPMTFLDARNARELGTRQHYAGLVAKRDRGTLDRLGAEQDALNEEEQRLVVQREEVAVQTQTLAVRQDEVEAAMAERQAALEQTQGELAALVAEEQRRRQAEEEARAREAARRRAATRTASLRTAPGGIDVVPALTRASSVPPGEVPPVHPRAREAVQAAVDKIGTPYQWGANGPDAYDCSGLTTYAWGSVGVRLPRSSWMQQEALPPVPFEAIQPGDLVFYGSPVHHVGIYMGDGTMVNAPYTGTEVRVDSIYRHDYAGAGRPG